MNFLEYSGIALWAGLFFYVIYIITIIRRAKKDDDEILPKNNLN